MSEGHYGWVQECGEAFVSVKGQTQPAYADFRPNAAKYELKEKLVKNPPEQVENLDIMERISQLPPLLIEEGPYCQLIREARDVFIDGHFYACVAMCGISLGRLQRDKAAPYGASREHTMKQVRSILHRNKVLLVRTLDLCKRMADMRNDYAHGHGLKPKEDALKSLEWVYSFIDNETNLMRDYVIVDGILHRKTKR